MGLAVGVLFVVMAATAWVGFRAYNRGQRKREVVFMILGGLEFLTLIVLALVGSHQRDEREAAADKRKSVAVKSIVDATEAEGFKLARHGYAKEWESVSLDVTGKRAVVQIYVPNYDYPGDDNGFVVAKFVNGQWQIGCGRGEGFWPLKSSLEVTQLVTAAGGCPVGGWSPQVSPSPS